MPSLSALRGALIQEGISINVAGAANVTLLVDQAKYQRIQFTGALTGNIVVSFPVASPDDMGKTWSLGNTCTGAFTLTVAAPGQTGYLLSQGFRQDVAYDGTDMVPNDARALGATSVSIAITGNRTLTNAEARAGMIVLTGTPAGGFNLVVPNGVALYSIFNGTNQTATVKTAAGTGVTLATNKNALIFIGADGQSSYAVNTITG